MNSFLMKQKHEGSLKRCVSVYITEQTEPDVRPQAQESSGVGWWWWWGLLHRGAIPSADDVDGGEWQPPGRSTQSCLLTGQGTDVYCQRRLSTGLPNFGGYMKLHDLFTPDLGRVLAGFFFFWNLTASSAPSVSCMDRATVTLYRWFDTEIKDVPLSFLGKHRDLLWWVFGPKIAPYEKTDESKATGCVDVGVLLQVL